MRLKLISSERLYREMATAISRSVNEVDAEYLPPGLHRSERGAMRQALQEALDRIHESRYHAVLLACEPCHEGLQGLRSGSIPLVLPRVLGPAAWRRGDPPCVPSGAHPSHPPSPGRSSPCWQHALAARRSGRAGTLHEARPWDVSCLGAGNGRGGGRHAAACGGGMASWGSGWAAGDRVVPGADGLECQAAREAAWFGWDFEKAQRDLPLIQRFLDGYWSYHEFFVVPPGFQIAAGPEPERLRAEELHS